MKKSLSILSVFCLLLASLTFLALPGQASAESYDYVLYKYRSPTSTPESFKKAELGRRMASNYRGVYTSVQERVRNRLIPAWLSNEPLPKNNVRDIQNNYNPSAFDRAEYGRWLSSGYRGSRYSSLRIHGSRPEREDFKREIPQPRTSSDRYNLGKRVRFTSEAGWNF